MPAAAVPRALVIDNPPPSRPDRASAELAARGWRVCRACPALGDALPAPEAFDAVLLLGGDPLIGAEEACPFLREEYRFADARLASGRPMAGFGLGAQIIARAMGAEVGPAHGGAVEKGWFPIRPTPAGTGLMPDPLSVFQWHEHGFGLPFGATRLAASALFPNQAVRFAVSVYGFQFRPELTLDAQERLLAGAARTGDDGVGRQAPAARTCNDAEMRAWFGGFFDRFLSGSGLGCAGDRGLHVEEFRT